MWLCARLETEQTLIAGTQSRAWGVANFLVRGLVISMISVWGKPYVLTLLLRRCAETLNRVPVTVIA
jgi:hypothetical protein